MQQDFRYPLIIGDSHAFFLTKSLGEINKGWIDEIDKPLEIIKDNNSVVGEYFMLNGKSDIFQKKYIGDKLQIEVTQLAIEYLLKNHSKYSSIIINLDGNKHNAEFMIEANKLFDFWDEKIPFLIPDRQIVPRNSVLQYFRQITQITQIKASILGKMFSNFKIYYILPPPPISSQEHILKFPEIFNFKERKIQPPEFRIKIYSAYCEIQKEISKNLNATILNPTDRNTDSKGFLKEEYWEGCTHANVDYWKNIILSEKHEFQTSI